MKRQNVETSKRQNEKDSVSTGPQASASGSDPSLPSSLDPSIPSSPNVPNPGFVDYAKLILTTISVNLGMPPALLLLDPPDQPAETPT